MWLLAGLGNPGKKYERNRHNIGFMVLDELERRHGLGPFRDRFNGQIASGMIGLSKVLLLKPMEYMNLSGFALQRAADYYDVPVDRIAVVHDELDLDPGRVKLKSGGGHGGHNGLRSIIDQLGDNGFARVRVGIGKPGRPDGEGGDKKAGSGYVLSDFPAAQRDLIDDAIRLAADACEAIVDRGIVASMNEFNVREKASDAPAAS